MRCDLIVVENQMIENWMTEDWMTRDFLLWESVALLERLEVVESHLECG